MRKLLIALSSIIMKFFLIFTILLSFSPRESFAVYQDEVGFSLGMSMLTLTENATALEGENISDAESASVGAISANIYWKFLPMQGKSFYLTATAPMVMISSGDNYFNLSTGFEYYFSDGAHRSITKLDGISLTTTPKLRYLAFTEVGISYVSYTTEVSKKNDTFVEASVGAGFSYTFSENWALKANASLAMGAGVLTNPMVIKFFAGGVFFLGK